MSDIVIEQYSEKAIVVRGNTEPFKKEFLTIGGKWNSGLKGGAGWIYANGRKSQVEELIEKIKSGGVKGEAVSTPEEKRFVSLKDYLQLLSRVERLEQIVANVDFIKGSSISSSSSSSRSVKQEDVIIFEDDEEEEEEKPVERLLRKKK
jgi:hypothetical protein